MNRDEIVWLLECCLLSLDNHSKEEMVKFGCPEELADSGIKLYLYLKNKDLMFKGDKVSIES